MKRGDPFTLEREQLLRRDLDEVFTFFADPGNLEAITPPWLHFRILGSSTPKVGEGTKIDYRLRLRGVPIKWRSLITDWTPPFAFVDQQVRGPYRVWIHRHTFEQTADGILMRDRVDYSMIGGALVNRLLVRRDLDRIFEYRQEAMKRIFADD